MLNRFAAAVFDMDGLLLDTERQALDSFNRVCAQLGLGDQWHVFVRCIGANRAAGRRAIEEGLRGRVDIETFERAWDELHATMLEQGTVPVKPGAIELLDDLAASGVRCAVATSTSTARATRKLQQAGLLARFTALVGGDQVPHSKPHPGIYLHAAATLGVPPARCLALEDSEHGVRAAHGAGMTVVQVPDLLPPSPELRLLGHIVLDSLHAVRTHRFDRP